MRNPLSGFWEAVAAGGVPMDRDLQAESIPERHWTAIRRHVRSVHALRSEGLNGEARQLARELSEDWVRRLGEDWVPPRTSDLDEYDPQKLAADVPRN